MEQLEPRTLLTAAISFLPQEGIGTITQEGPNTVLTLNPGTTTASISVRVSPTDISFVDYQLDLRASELGEGKLAIADWVTASGFSATDGTLGFDDNVVSGASTGGAVLDAATIGSFTLFIPTEPGDYLLSALAGPVYTGELFYSRFINRIEETIEDFNSLINVTAIRDFSGNSVVVENQDYPNIFKTAYSYDGGTGELTYGPSQSVAQTLGADGIVSTSEFIIVGGQNSELFKVPINGGEVETATLNPDGGAFHMTLNPAGDRVWTSMEPGNILAEVPIANFGSGIIEHNISGDDTQINKIAFAPALSQQGNFAYYANSDRDGGLTGGDGHFGILDLTSFVTTRKFTNLPAAHSIAYDPYTGDLLLFGARSIVQVDISDPMDPQIRSTLDLSSQLNAIAQNVRVDGTLAGFPANNFNTDVPLNIIDHSTVDGFGHAIAAVNTGHFIFLDYAGNTPSASLIENGTVFIAEDSKLPFLHTFLEGFAPVVGANSNGGTLLTTEGASVPLADTGNLIIRVASESASPTITIEPTDDNASEAGLDTATFTVSRTGPTDADIEVFYSVLDASTASTGDYEALSGSVTIPAGQTTAIINILPTDDATVESSETVILTLNPSASYIIGGGTATVTINDNDTAASLTITATDAVASEEDPPNNTAAITLTRTGSLAQELVIQYGVSGTAGNGVDYVALPAEIVIPAGEASYVLTITAIDDAATEGTETVNAEFFSPIPIVGGNTASVSIEDNEASNQLPEISIAATDSDAGEAPVPNRGTFTITRSGATNTQVQVFFTISGNATNGSDYAALSGSTIFGPGVTSIPISVQPQDDPDAEFTETVILTLNANAAYTLGASNSAMVTITDNDTNAPVTVTLTTSDSEASESVGTASFTFTRNGDLSNALSINYGRGGVASPYTDFAAIGTSTFIQAGQSSVTIHVQPLADNLTEGDEALIVTLFPIAGSYKVGGIGLATITIHDDPTAQPVTLGGEIWNDLNGNGTRDVGEPNLGNRFAYLDLNDSGAHEIPEPTASPNFDTGIYSFTNLTPGHHKIGFQNPTNFISVRPVGGFHEITAVSGEVRDDLDSAARFPTSTARIRGDVYADLNSNGSQNSNEPTVPGAIVYIDENNDSQYQFGERSYVINQANNLGSYDFAALQAGTYHIGIVPPVGGVDVTEPQSGFYTITVVDGQTVEDQDFGLGVAKPTLSIAASALDVAEGQAGNFIFVIRTGDSPVDLPVTLVVSGTAKSGTDYLAFEKTFEITTFTDTYFLNFDAFTDSIDEGGETINVTIKPNAAYNIVDGTLTITINDAPPAPGIYGTKFADLDGNGQRDAGEPGLPGWTMFLDENDNGILDEGEQSTITGLDGSYSFTDIGAGEFHVGEVAQDEWTQTLPTPQQGNVQPGLHRVITGLDRPVFATAPTTDADHLFILEQHTGKIQILDLSTNTLLPTPLLDLDDLSTGNEQGLLGLAFDPLFVENGFFYVNYTNAAGDTVIARYTASTATLVAVPNSATTILTIDQPQSNHNGGWIGFGPDNLLYIATGDGGNSYDQGGGHTEPDGNAQDITDNLLGKILRIDPSSDGFPADPDRHYAIPVGNPFVATDGDHEIFAFGLRNPWRNSFDPQTGDFIIADVGQDNYEEINLLPSGAPGGPNFGWRLREGFEPTPNVGGDHPDFALDPAYVYPHGFGEFSGMAVVGGYVYRGPVTSLQGKYFFADAVNPRLWTLEHNSATLSTFEDLTDELTPDVGVLQSISSFGTDAAQNLYITDLGNGGDDDGSLFVIEARQLPATISVVLGEGDIRENIDFGNQQTGSDNLNMPIGGAIKSINYLEQDGTRVSIALTGQTGVVALAGSGLIPLTVKGVTVIAGQVSSVNIALQSDPAASPKGALTFKTTGGADNGVATINSVSGYILGTLNGKTVDLSGGSLTFEKYISTTALRDLTNGADIDFEGTDSPKPLVMTFQSVGNDSVIHTHSGIGSLTANNFATGSDIDSTFIAKLATKALPARALGGDMAADLALSGLNAPAGVVLGSAAIGGDIADGNWQIGGSGHAGAITAADILAGWEATFTGDIKALTSKAGLAGELTANSIAKLSVKTDLHDAVITLLRQPDPVNAKLLALGSAAIGGSMIDSVINSAGRIGAATMAAMIDSVLFAGWTVQDDEFELPELAADLGNASIAAVTIKGLKGAAGAPVPSAFVNSLIAAKTIGKVALKNVQLDNDGDEFGIAAVDIGTLTLAQADGGKFTWPDKWLTDPVDLVVRELS